MSNEQIMVAFGIGGAYPLAVSGPSVEIEVDADASGFAEVIRDDGLTRNDPDNGVWVWEGVPIPEYSDNWEHGAVFEGYDYRTGTWRKPTSTELVTVANGDRPWPIRISEEPGVPILIPAPDEDDDSPCGCDCGEDAEDDLDGVPCDCREDTRPGSGNSPEEKVLREALEADPDYRAGCVDIAEGEVAVLPPITVSMVNDPPDPLCKVKPDGGTGSPLDAILAMRSADKEKTEPARPKPPGTFGCGHDLAGPQVYLGNGKYGCGQCQEEASARLESLFKEKPDNGKT